MSGGTVRKYAASVRLSGLAPAYVTEAVEFVSNSLVDYFAPRLQISLTMSPVLSIAFLPPGVATADHC